MPMKITYENELRSLQNWIDNADFGLASRGAVTTDSVSANNIPIICGYWAISSI